MRGLKRNPWLFGLGVLLAVLVVYGGHARADVNTDQSGSIVLFPKVIADGTRDTMIQITNTSNMSAQAHCFYIASGSCSESADIYCNSDAECPTSETCVLPCNEIDFDLFLTAQQPTMWRVSSGRIVDITTPPCKINGGPCQCSVDYLSGGIDCPGFDPGTGSQGSFAVKPTGTHFRGELKCIQTDDSFQTPIMQNSLKGEAVIETLESGQVSEYNALAITALPGLNGNNDLLLNNTEYNACPRNLIMNHFTDFARDDFTGSDVVTELTLVPCTELLEEQIPTRTRALFTIVNEFEQPLSAAITFDCFLNLPLFLISENFTESTVASQFAKTRITPPQDTICATGDNRGLTCDTNADCPNFLTTPDGTQLGCRPWSGVLGVAEEYYISGLLRPGGPKGIIPLRPPGTAAFNLHVEGSRSSTASVPADIIVVPQGEGLQ